MIDIKEIILMIQKIKSYRQNKKREAFKALVVVVALGLIAWGVFALMSELSKKAEEPSGEMIGDNTSEEVSDEEADGYIGGHGETNDDKEAEGGSDRPDDPSVDENTGLAEANVIVNFAGSEGDDVVASGTIMNMFENNGTCVYTFTNTSGKTIELQSSTLPSANSMPCAEVRASRSEFGTGKWSVILKYESNSAKGESDRYDFEIN